MKTEAEIIAVIVNDLPANIQQAVNGGVSMDVYRQPGNKSGFVVIVASLGLEDHLRQLFHRVLADQCDFAEADVPL